LKRQVASKRESRDYIEAIRSASGMHLELPRSAQVEVVEPSPGLKFLVIDGRHTFLDKEGDLVPFVGSQETLALLPSAFIDEGAIRFILKGADVMRPGIVRYDAWGAKDALVVIRDDGKGRALAVGRATVQSDEMAGMSKGVAIRSLHHAGDPYWDSHKNV
jgi:malignant T-cell-amplified sequence